MYDVCSFFASCSVDPPLQHNVQIASHILEASLSCSKSGRESSTHSVRHDDTVSQAEFSNVHMLFRTYLRTYQVIPIYALYLDGTAAFNNFGKFGVPSPLTGSHPAVAFQLAYGMTGLPFGGPLNLAWPSHPVLPPSTMSLSAPGFAYSNGFKNPSEGLPVRSLASLRSATMPPNAGAEHEVPW